MAEGDTVRNAERSGNELCHGDWRDYDYEYDSLLYSYKSTLNPKGQTKAQGIFKWTFHPVKGTKGVSA